MAVWTGGTSGDDIADWSYEPLNPGEGSHVMRSFEGNDQLQGALYVRTTLDGGPGDDLLIGGTLRDLIIGGADEDTLAGAGDNDNIFGNAGDDWILGESGNDFLAGNAGNDLYQQTHGAQGVDRVNEDVNQAGNVGYGSGSDALYFDNVTNEADVYFGYTPDGTGLIVTTHQDMEDNTQGYGFIVEKFFLGSQYVVEGLYLDDGLPPIDLTQFLPAATPASSATASASDLEQEPEMLDFGWDLTGIL